MDEPPPRTTASMLAEIDIGSAAEAIMALRYRTSPPGIFYHDPLDRVIREARAHAGSSVMQRGDLLQVIGPSGSGKTTFLLFLLMTTILPTTWNFYPPSVYARGQLPVQLGGRHFHAAVLYPETHGSPLPRLVRAMRAHVERCLKDAVGVQALVPALQEEVEMVIRDSLRRLRVVKVRPRWKDWALSIRRLSLPHTASPRDGGSAERRREGLDLMICDGLGDGYWPERWMEEERQMANSSTARKMPSGIRGAEHVGMREVFEGVGRLRKELGSVVVLSVQAFWHEKREGQSTGTSTPFFSNHLPPPFPSPWNTRDENPSTVISKDPTFWPLNVELTMTGKQARMQLPAETLLADALRGAVSIKAAAHGGDEGVYAMYNGLIRVPEGRGRAGTRDGVGWTFEVGHEGFGACPPD